MRTICGIALACGSAFLFLAGSALGREQSGSEIRLRLAQQRVCAQVIHCGIKNGQAKEYPTRCAAEDDGATEIAPKTGPTCPAPK
jgi:hypothetical protein